MAPAACGTILATALISPFVVVFLFPVCFLFCGPDHHGNSEPCAQRVVRTTDVAMEWISLSPEQTWISTGVSVLTGTRPRPVCRASQSSEYTELTGRVVVQDRISWVSSSHLFFDVSSEEFKFYCDRKCCRIQRYWLKDSPPSPHTADVDLEKGEHDEFESSSTGSAFRISEQQCCMEIVVEHCCGSH